ncbi:MAG: hypothetical protein ACREIA_21145 [Opitutaceae bacterium]
MKMEKETNDMLAENAVCQKALANLSRALDARRWFPEAVFLGQWSSFLFFDSDWIFEGPFVEKAKALLQIEGGQCAGISNLDEAVGGGGSSFFIDQKIAGQDYQSFLKGPRVGDGWIYGVDRFGCTSDVGQWCIYCERRNEIAVIAVRESRAVEKYRAAIAQFKAMPIDQAVALPLSYGFSERALSAEWRAELLKHYAMRSG